VTQAIQPVTAALSGSQYDGKAELAYLHACKNSGRLAELVLVDGRQAVDELGSTRILNVVLIGAALATGRLGISDDAIAAAIETLVKPGYVHINKQALSYGRQLGLLGQLGQLGQLEGK
jgi:indolepyruvate ferredoxin oxidoreductase beta subunit